MLDPITRKQKFSNIIQNKLIHELCHVANALFLVPEAYFRLLIMGRCLGIKRGGNVVQIVRSKQKSKAYKPKTKQPTAK